MGWKQILSSVVSIVGAVVILGGVAAAQSTSPNYRVDEYFFGSGGELEACSDEYCAKQSAGELAAGRTASANYQAQVGFNTSDMPILEVAVNGNINFGELEQNTTATGEANVQVRTYLSSGYNMIIAGPAPKITSHTMAAPNMPSFSTPGTEQFGINLVDNSSPNVGDGPEQVPDGSFSFGLPTANYNIPNQFMYQDGAIVASSNMSSGQTNYTLSFIANMSKTTPAGKYTTDLSVVVVAAF
jgi:hypothetical protein